MLITRTAGEAIHPVGMLTYQLIPGRHRRRVTGRAERRVPRNLGRGGRDVKVRAGLSTVGRQCGHRTSGVRQGGGRRSLLVWVTADRAELALRIASVNHRNTSRRRGIPPPVRLPRCM